MILVGIIAAKEGCIHYYQANEAQNESEQIAKNAQDQSQDQEGGYIKARRRFVGVGMRIFHCQVGSSCWYSWLMP